MANVHALLSDESEQGWRDLATTEGVTLSALLEAIGRMLHDGIYPQPRRFLDLAVRNARDVDAARRSRRKD